MGDISANSLVKHSSTVTADTHAYAYKACLPKRVTQCRIYARLYCSWDSVKYLSLSFFSCSLQGNDHSLSLASLLPLLLLCPALSRLFVFVRNSFGGSCLLAVILALRKLSLSLLLVLLAPMRFSQVLWLLFVSCMTVFTRCLVDGCCSLASLLLALLAPRIFSLSLN
jgi:hypothetical protein